jgi:mannose-6-phosphate isomerase
MKLMDILKNLNNKIKIEKPWGHELIWSDSDKYLGKVIFIKKGESLSYQYHNKKEETIYIINGPMKLDIGDEKDYIVLNNGDSYKIPPLEKHRFSSIDSDVMLVEVSSYHPDDVVRVEDKYGRS